MYVTSALLIWLCNFTFHNTSTFFCTVQYLIASGLNASYLLQKYSIFQSGDRISSSTAAGHTLDNAISNASGLILSCLLKKYSNVPLCKYVTFTHIWDNIWRKQEEENLTKCFYESHYEFKVLAYSTEVSLFFNLILVYTDAFIPPWHKFQNSATVKTGFLHFKSFTYSHFHFLITIVLVTSQMLLQWAKEIICPAVWSFSKEMQSHTAQIRHKNCCSCFFGNFQNNKDVEMALPECLQMQGIFKLMSTWGKFICVLGDYG